MHKRTILFVLLEQFYTNMFMFLNSIQRLKLLKQKFGFKVESLK